jgi:hypothetical protein
MLMPSMIKNSSQQQAATWHLKPEPHLQAQNERQQKLSRTEGEGLSKTGRQFDLETNQKL